MKIRDIVFLLFLLISVTFESNSQSTASGFKFQSWPYKENKSIIKKLSNSRIQFINGFELMTGTKLALGGLSALWTSENGERIIAVSDFSMESNVKEINKSKWFDLQLTYNKRNVLKDIVCTKHGQFILSSNKVIHGELESLAYINKRFYLSFDNKKKLGNTILTFDKDGVYKKKGKYFWKANKDKFTIPHYPTEYYNEGIEAITETKESDLFVIHERLPGKRTSSLRYCWLINPISKSYRTIKYNSSLKEVKGAATLNNGDILILEKNYSGGTTIFKILRIAKKDLNKNNLTGEIILKAESKYFDNFEGITCFQRNGESYVVIISDDNSDWNRGKQKTLMLIFKLLI